MKVSFVAVGLVIGTVISAQTPATQLRVITDANDYLYVASAAQVNPLSQPTPFSQIRLRTDAAGALLITGVSGFDPTESHDFTATQYFSGICFGTEASFDGCLQNDTAFSPPTGDTTKLVNGTTRQTLRIYGTDTGVNTTSYFMELRASTGEGNAGLIRVNRGDGLAGATPLSLKGETYVLIGSNASDNFGVFNNVATIGIVTNQTRSNSQWSWSSGSVDATTASDTGLARDAAAEVRVTNGSTGHGVLDAASYKVNDAAGASATCASGVDAITVSGGIVTAITCTP